MNQSQDRSTKEEDRIPRGVKLAYGTADGSSGIFYGVYSTYYLFFMTDVVGISATLAGAIIFISHSWDAVTDIGMGIISDRTNSRFGRRRPYILGAALPFGILVWMMFYSPNLQINGILQAAYYIVILMLVFLMWTVYQVPYTALAPEMTSDYNERTNLISYKIAFAMVGAVVGTAVPLMIVEQYTNPKEGWGMVGFSFGIVCIVLLLTTWRFTRGWERGTVDVEKFDIKEMLQSVVSNRPFRYVLGLYLFSMSFVYGFEALAVYYLQYYLKLSPDHISLFMFVLFLSSVLWIPFVAFISGQIGKKNAFIVFLGCVSFITGSGFMLIQPGQEIFLYLLAIASGMGMASAYELIYAMIPDVTEIDEFKTGKRREGLIYGVISLLHKSTSAISMLLVGFYLDWIKYIPNLDQSTDVLFGLRLVQGPVSGAFLLTAVIIACFMPLTPKTYAALLKAIEAKRAGKNWDAASIEALM